MKCVRIPDGKLPENPGEISKHRVTGKVTSDSGDSGITVSQDMWFFIPPNGEDRGLCRIGPKPMGGGHQVDELEDGSIQVIPHPTPDNSNSILVAPHNDYEGWHGYIRNGEWESC